jgi:hypothetical protein
MKKLLYILGFVVVLFTACDPNGDFLDTLDKEAKPAGIDIPEQLTLESGDYSLVDKNGMFASKEEAAKLIPQILSETYAANASNQGFLMEVTYKLDGTDYLSDVYSEDDEYELSDEDYKDGMGFKYPNFSNTGTRDQYLPVFLKDKFKFTQTAGMEKVIVYTLRGAMDMYHEYKFDGAAWVKTSKTDGGFDVDNAYELSKDDYDSMGEERGEPGKYDNFDYKMDIESYLNNFLLDKYSGAQTDDIKTIKFKFYGNNKDKVVYSFDGENWNQKGKLVYDWTKGDYLMEEVVLEATDKFVYDSKDGWEIIVITTYTLTDDDYALTGDDKYKNFGYYDDKAGEYKGKQVDNILDAKINQILLVHFVSAEEGALFEITYKFYNNGSTNDTKRRYKKEGDKFVRVVE